ncbi:MAG: insulinase family protein, partial [Holosporaceae bacterium]|nr:insulinase family protein [Holosporaceae bacterium]
KKLKIITSIAVIALISIPIFLKNEKQPLEIVTVSNGMGIKTSLVQVNSEDVIYIRSKFKGAGVRCNPPEQHGISLVACCMLFDEINGLSREETTEKKIDLGIHEFSTFANDEDFCFHFYITKDKIIDALTFLSHAFSDMNFSSSYLEYVKKLYPSIQDVETSIPQELLRQRLWNMLYQNSVYGMCDTGSSQSISSITTKDVQDFVRNTLRRDNLEVVFVGKISRFEIDDYLKILFAGLPEAKEKKSDPMTPTADLSEETEAVIIRPGMRDVVCTMTGIRIDQLSDMEKAALYVIIDSLFNSRTGDFCQGLRKRNIAYDISYEMVQGDMSNVFSVSACLDKKDLESYKKYLDEKFAEYQKILDLKALGKTKNYFIKISNNGFKSLKNLAEKIKDAALPFDEITEEILEKVSQKLFQKSLQRTVIIGDIS